MKSPLDARLRGEARRFALRFSCEDCAHFDVRRQACVHGYPEGPRQMQLHGGSDELVFCKEFELL